MQAAVAPQAPKRRRVDPSIESVEARDTAAMQAQLRRLVEASRAQRQHASAVWYADKLLTAGGQQPGDALLLASCLYDNGEYQHAVHILTHHGLIDTGIHRHPMRCAAENAGLAAAIGTGGVLADPALARAVASGLSNNSTSPAEPLPGAIALKALPAFLLAAQCYKALKAWDRCLSLLESCMEGQGMPPLLVPMLVPEEDAADGERAAAAAGQVISSWTEDIDGSPWVPPVMPADSVPSAPNLADAAAAAAKAEPTAPVHPAAKAAHLHHQYHKPAAGAGVALSGHTALLRASHVGALGGPVGTLPSTDAALLKQLASPIPRSSALSGYSLGTAPHRTLRGEPTVGAALEVESDVPDPTQLVAWAAVHESGTSNKAPHSAQSALNAVLTGSYRRPHAAATAAATPAVPRPLDGYGVWRLIKGMACEWADQHFAANDLPPLGTQSTPAAAVPSRPPSRGGGGFPVPVTDGSALNIVACLCEVRGEALLASDSRERATHWLLAALRCDIYCARALHLLCSEHLLGDVREVQLLRYVTAVTSLPVVRPAEHTSQRTEAPRQAEDHLHSQGEARKGEPIMLVARAQTADAKGARVGTGSAPLHLSGSAGGESSEAPQPVDNLWLCDLFASRLNRFSLGVTAAAKFAALDFTHGLGGSVDVLCSKADLLFAQHDPAAALAVSRRALAADPFCRPLLLLHYALLVTLREPTELHRLAQAAMLAAPRDPCSWYATGCYYLAASRPAVAVQQLTKATQLDPGFAQAWTALGAAYAATEDTEPALAAYRVAQRLWPHSHIPVLAMSSLCLRQGHTTLARQYMNLAASRCASDPLVYHEAGVAEYVRGNFSHASQMFSFAFSLVEHQATSSRRHWIATALNAGHSFRKLGALQQAIQWYDTARSLDPCAVEVIVAQGFTQHLAGHLDAAILLYHEALSLAPHDSLVQRMLALAMQDGGAAAATRESSSFAAFEATLPAHHTETASSASTIWDIFSRLGVTVEGAEEMGQRGDLAQLGSTARLPAIAESASLDDILELGVGLSRRHQVKEDAMADDAGTDETSTSASFHESSAPGVASNALHDISAATARAIGVLVNEGDLSRASDTMQVMTQSPGSDISLSMGDNSD